MERIKQLTREPEDGSVVELPRLNHAVQDELREIGGRTLFLYPIFHPAAALYTPAMLERLREDIRALPELLAQPLPGDAPEPAPEPEREPELAAVGAPEAPPVDQLGLF